MPHPLLDGLWITLGTWFRACHCPGVGRFAEEWPACSVARARADWVRRGVGRGTLRGRGYERVAPGFYRVAVSGTIAPAQRILDAVAVMPPGAVNAGWAAAY